jgi:glycosyltransferase 2 family protein
VRIKLHTAVRSPGSTRLLRVILYWSVIGAIAYFTWDSLRSAAEVARHNTDSVVVAIIMSTTSTLAFAHAWRDHIGLYVAGNAVTVDYITSNLAKYLPFGSVVQYARQSHRVGVRGGSLRDGAIGSVRFALKVVGVAGAVGALMAAAIGEIFVALLCIGAVPFASNVAQERLLQMVPGEEWSSPGDSVYRPRPWWALVWMGIGVLTFGASFALLAKATGLETDSLRLATTGVVSWLAGFLVIPVPSGAGIREAVAAFLSEADSGALLVASTLLHRGIGAIGDVAAASTGPLLLRLRPAEIKQ